jgi:hypothetical protein
MHMLSCLSNIYAIWQFYPLAALRCLIAEVLPAHFIYAANLFLIFFIVRSENYLTIFVKKMSPLPIEGQSDKYGIDEFQTEKREEFCWMFCRVAGQAHAKGNVKRVVTCATT